MKRARDFADVFDINNPQPYRFDVSDIVEELADRYSLTRTDKEIFSFILLWRYDRTYSNKDIVEHYFSFILYLGPQSTLYIIV